MAKRGKKRYGMSGARRRNVKCDIKDSKFKKIPTKEDDDYMLYLAFMDGCQESGTEREDSLDHKVCNDNEDDPQYMIFLENTAQKGTSYVTTIEENGLHLCLHYEKEVSSSVERNDVHGRKVKKTRKGDEGKGLEDLKVKNNVERPKVLRSDMGNCEKSMLDEPSNHVSMGKSPMSGKQYECNMKNNSDKEQRTSRTGGEENHRDEDYARFMQCLECEGYSLKPLNRLFSDNKYVEYDRDDSGDVEVLEIDCSTFDDGGNFRACVPSVDYCEVGNTLDEDSQFRKEITSILKRPYDQAEHEKLLQDVKVQKPVERKSDLRYGRERRCPLNGIGKSYLDYFDDFNNKFEEVSPDKHKMLNMLRGFFFWLQNISQAKAFKPWEDPDCLDIMLGSCQE